THPCGCAIPRPRTGRRGPRSPVRTPGTADRSPPSDRTPRRTSDDIAAGVALQPLGATTPVEDPPLGIEREDGVVGDGFHHALKQILHGRGFGTRPEGI